MFPRGTSVPRVLFTIFLIIWLTHYLQNPNYLYFDVLGVELILGSRPHIVRGDQPGNPYNSRGPNVVTTLGLAVREQMDQLATQTTPCLVVTFDSWDINNANLNMF